MKGTLNQRFKCSFESSAAASYLVITMGAQEKIQQYQVEMIMNNTFAGILNMDVRQKDDTVNLYYNITSRIPLSQFLSRKKLARNEVIHILENIASVLVNARTYLLSDKSFLLDEEHIYINPGTAEISLAYIPVALEICSLEDVKSFIIQLMVYRANIDEDGSDNFLQRILAYVKAETFHPAGFVKFLKDLRNQYAVGVWNHASEPEKKTTTGHEALPQQEALDQYKPQKEAERLHKDLDTVPKRKIPLPKQEKTSGIVGNNPRKNESEPGKKYNASTILIAVLSQVALAVIIVMSSGFLKTVSDDIVTTYAGIGIIVLALDVLLFRKLFNKKNIVGKSERRAAARPVPVPASKPNPMELSKREIRSIPDVPSERTENPVADHREEIRFFPDGMHPKDGPATIPSYNPLNETTFLGEVEKRPPYLQGKRDGLLEEIFITKPSFIIGRLRDQADYVSQNNAIGKVHAEIIHREGAYFIKDLNSRNGTFINDLRIESNKEYWIKNSDKIGFANSEYKFFNPGETDG